MTRNISGIVRDLEAQGVRLPRVRLRAAVVVAKPTQPKGAGRGTGSDSAKKTDVTARRDQVAALWRDGKSARQIATALGCSDKKVAYDVAWLQAQGLVALRKATPHDVEARRALIVDMHKAGLTAQAISDKLNMPVTSVRSDIYVLQDRGALPHRIGPRSADRTVM